MKTKTAIRMASLRFRYRFRWKAKPSFMLCIHPDGKPSFSLSFSLEGKAFIYVVHPMPFLRGGESRFVLHNWSFCFGFAGCGACFWQKD